MLDEAGFNDAQIFVSGDLDEEVIWDLRAQGAAIDVWGVGTKMITSDDLPALGAYISFLLKLWTEWYTLR